jgi:hypothetical protein
MKHTLLALTALAALTTMNPESAEAGTFNNDLQFIRKYTEVVLLSDAAIKAQVAVVPAWQGRVATSSANGFYGTSFGWINRDLIASKKIAPHFNPLGGEDRFWLGPEGGQFSIFFPPNAPFDLEHWQTPAAIDTEPFQVVRQSSDSVLCRTDLRLTNYSGTSFRVEVNREVRLLQAVDLLKSLGLPLPARVKPVAYESVNSVKNTGDKAWEKETGLLSMWILGMFNASPKATIVIPFEKGAETERGPIVNDTYFGKVPADRLVVKDGVMFFRADADYRSKIGLSPRRVKPLLGSYDAESRTLTLVHFTLPAGATEYVNSMWEIQKNPYGGDVLNSYNDGPSKPEGKRMGRFFELESSSPALALAPGASATHIHQTVHLQGSEKDLEAIATAAFGVGLEEIKAVFGAKK